MTRILIALIATLATLISCNAFAQTMGPSEDRSSPSEPSTAQERAAARAERNAVGKELGKEDAGRLEQTSDPALQMKTYTPQEREAARAARRAAGSEMGNQGSGESTSKPIAP